MARQATIILTVDSSGAVQDINRVDGELDDLGASARSASAGIEQTEDSMDGASRSAKKYASSASTAKSTTQRLSRSMKVALTAAATAAAAALARSAGRMAAQLFKLGVDIEETANNFEKQFGRMAGDMRDWMQDWKDLTSVTQLEGEKMLATIGSIFDGLGFTSEQTAELSKRAASLAADLSSIQNVPLQQALDAVTASMLGQNRQLKSLGVSVNESVTRQKALEAGIIETDRALTAQERAAAAVKAVHDRMGSSVGDAADTQDSMRRKSENLERDLRSLREEIARELMPTFERLTDQASQWAEKDSDKVTDAVVSWTNAFVDFGETLVWATKRWQEFENLTPNVLGVEVKTSMLLNPLRMANEINRQIFGEIATAMGGGGQSGVSLEQQSGLIDMEGGGGSQGVGGLTPGGGGGGEESGLSAAQKLRKELEKEMQIIERMVRLPVGPGAQDRLQEQIETLKTLLKDAAKDTGIEVGSDIVQEMRGRLRELQVRQASQRSARAAQGPTATVRGRGPDTGSPLEGPFGMTGKAQKQVDGAKKNVDDLTEKTKELTQEQKTLASAAGRAGAELVSAFKRGRLEAEDLLGVAANIATKLIPGGSVIGQIGRGLLSAFQHGGVVDTPLQVVGERGPELAALPKNSRVMSNREMKQTVGRAARADQSAIASELGKMTRRLETLDLKLDTFDVSDEMNSIQSEQQEFGSRIYEPRA